MKKLLCILAAALLLGTGASADEGMWLLPLLQKMNAGAMKDLGCRLTPDQIYSINHSSLKDAIVQFGGGCTGEMISKEGLLVTNHHCGYSSIQSLSSDEHNYLEDGYWAMDRSQELPVPGLTVTFLVSMEDVTGIVEANEAQFRKAFADSADAGRLVAEAMARWEKTFEEEAVADTPACTARVQSFYNDNVYYLIKYKTYRDVRFVGAPPASIGKFGGETDNWMWPRHTGDFSMFRVYAGKDNLPADYSLENVPYEPAQALKVSLKGIQEGDFTMIMGYPGRTQRFQTVAQLEQMMAQHDISIDARTLRQDIMKKYMEASPSVRLKYADKYAGSSNGWKKWIGERKAFKDLDIIGREREKEAAFTKWVNKNGKRKARYGKALDDIAEGVARNAPNMLAVQLLAETVLNIELLDNANYFARQYQTALRTQPGDTAAALDAAFAAMEDIYADYYEPLDREETAALLEHYRSHADTSCFLQGLGGDFATMDLKAYAARLFNESIFTSPEKLKTVYAEGFGRLREDPAVTLLNAAVDVFFSLQSGIDEEAENKIAEGSKAFTAGLLEKNKGAASYPDANFTMRLTYGTVQPYSPKDALTYRYYTTIYGVIEKENPDDYEFRVPAKLIDLYNKKDYGKYAMADGNLPVCFLTTNDITGGNSGSPVLDAEGRLIGLAFDGNWESMSSDVMFEPKLQRCICVDIRYVLFLVDKFGGAGYLLKEMEIEQ
ncbi:MAG: S46 family peptidase [Bacteroidales bacterium]|nr:S46 family peptidase [Bacteroidales bacterium]